MFYDRKEAGKLLAEKLGAYKNAADTVVVALPRGGVVVGRAVADALELLLDIVVPRKIGAPGNEEYAIGAICGNAAVWNERERAIVDTKWLEEKIAAEKTEAARRISTYRKGMQPEDFHGKTILLVDDGIATGLTMRAAIKHLKAQGVAKIVVAVPIAPPETIATFTREADEVIALHQPLFFGAVGFFYEHFKQVEDEEVVALMQKSRRSP